MSDALVLVSDSAVPFDYSRLPKGVACHLGYVGQLHETPHLWTETEIADCRKAVGAWAPIWTVPPTGFTVDVGKQAGNGMAAALRKIDYLAAGPVFLDVEHKTWAENPSRAIEAVDAWEATMRAAGWPNAHPYLPIAAHRGWGADWTNVRPTVLPAGLIGQQYAGGQDGDRYDLSVFQASIFAPLLQKGTVTDVALTTADKAWITAQLKTLQTNVHNEGVGMYNNSWEGHAYNYSQKAILEAVVGLGTSAPGANPAPVDVAALAAQLAATLGPTLAASVAAELSKRLAT